MNRSFLGTCLLTALTIVSCGDPDSRAAGVSTPSTADTATVVSGGTTQQIGSSADSGNTLKVASPSATPAASPSVASAQGVALNPPHGQPGHRCDISVGAPLSSAPTNTAVRVNPTTSPIVAPAPASVKSTSAPVVAPAPVNPTSAPIVAPAPVTPSASGGIARLNPPHGQPGHDCSVKVGQPLP